MKRTDTDYVPYRQIAERLGLKKGSVVNVSSDVLRLALEARAHGETFDANQFIEGLQEAVGPDGTILFPTFTWDFCKGIPFDRRKAPSLMGALTNAALRRSDFRRTRHALYSFAVWGRMKDELCALDNISSWSADSPFGVMDRAHAINLFVGIDYKLAFTFDHYAEQTVGVPYRYHKAFRSTYIDDDGSSSEAEFTMYVRDLALKIETFVSPRLDEVLTKAGCYTFTHVNGIYFGQVDLHGACRIMEQDIREGGGLIYTAPERSAG